MRRLLLLVSLLAPGCRGAKDEPHVLRLEPRSDVHAFSTEQLFASPRLSAHHHAAIAPLPAHVHREHSETIYVLAGRGRMRVGEEWHEVEGGSLIHVPRGVVHALVPRGAIEALSLFSPPFDGRDRVFLAETEGPSPKEESP